MMESNILLIAVIILCILWVVPAVVLTIKVRNVKGLDAGFKRQLIVPMWLIPFIGSLVCYFVFAKIGKLNRLSADEHRRIWASAPKR